MDFKGWKKISEDGKSATLVHPKGHQMVIAVKALPKILQEQIKRLEFAEGGDVLDSGEGGKSTQGQIVRDAKRNPEIAKENYKQAKDEARGRAKLEKHVKPKIKGLAEGGEVPVSMPDPDKARQAWQGAQNGQSLSAGWQNLKSELGFGNTADNKDQQKRKSYAGGDDPADSVVQSDASKAPPININVGQPSAGPAQVVAQPVPVAAPAQAPQQMQAQPVPQQQLKNQLPAETLPMRKDQTVDVPGTVKEASEAGMKQAEIDAATAAERKQAIADNITQQQQWMNTVKQHYSDLSQHADDLAGEIKDINPKHYQENMGSGQKAATAIGLFLGGWGTAYGGHNYAMDFLNKQIDRDIDSQKANNENRKTVWGAYQDLYHNGVVADNMTRIAMTDLLDKKMQQAALNQGTQQAWQKYQEWRANYMQQRIQMLRESSALLGTLQLGGGGGGGNAEGVNSQAPQQNPQQMENNQKWHVLSPDAARKAKLSQFDPTIEKDRDHVMQQYNQAVQTDTAIDKMDDIFDRMDKNKNELGRLKDAIDDAGHDPDLLGVGKIASFLSNYGSDTLSNRRYLSAYSELFKSLRTAVPNAGDSSISEVARANAPVAGDPPELVKSKKDAIKRFLHDNAEKGYLMMTPLYNKRK